MTDINNNFIGTRPLSTPIDKSALLAWLTGNIEGFKGPLSISQFNGGQSNPTYKLVTASESYVMRSKPAPVVKLLPSAHAIEREFHVMQALQESDVPVPRMLAICEDEAVIGRAFYVMEHKAGRVLWDQSLPGMDRRARAAHYDEMNRVMAALHNVDVESAGLAGYGRPGNYFERQIGRWSKQYLASALEPNPAMDWLMDWLPDHIPSSAFDETKVSIVHGDYRLDNLVFHRTEPRVIALLDWELSTLGHPLADLSHQCMGWHVRPSSMIPGLSGLDIASLGIPSESDYVRRYCERTNRTDIDLVMKDWNFYLTYSFFRIAAIVQGIAKRVETDTASSAQARDAASSARPLADLAWQFAQKARRQ